MRVTELSIRFCFRVAIFSQVFSLGLHSAVLPEVTKAVGSGLRMEAKEIGSGAEKRILLTFSDPSRKVEAIAAHVYFIGKAPDGARFIYAHSDLSIRFCKVPWIGKSDERAQGILQEPCIR